MAVRTLRGTTWDTSEALSPQEGLLEVREAALFGRLLVEHSVLAKAETTSLAHRLQYDLKPLSKARVLKAACGHHVALDHEGLKSLHEGRMPPWLIVLYLTLLSETWLN